MSGDGAEAAHSTRALGSPSRGGGMGGHPLPLTHPGLEKENGVGENGRPWLCAGAPGPAGRWDRSELKVNCGPYSSRPRRHQSSVRGRGCPVQEGVLPACARICLVAVPSSERKGGESLTYLPSRPVSRARPRRLQELRPLGATPSRDQGDRRRGA